MPCTGADHCPAARSKRITDRAAHRRTDRTWLPTRCRRRYVEQIRDLEPVFSAISVVPQPVGVVLATPALAQQQQAGPQQVARIDPRRTRSIHTLPGAWSENNSRGVWRFGDLDMVAKPLQTLDVMALKLLLALAVVVVLAKVVIGNSVLDDEIDDRQYLVADGYD